MEFLTHVGLAFVPLFVAIDTPGSIPLFVGLTQGVDRRQRRRIVNQAVVVSLAIAVVFALTGTHLFRLLSITTADFQVGGGLLLFGYALTDILFTTRRRARQDPRSIGIVPLATPLIAGPALLTAIILMVQQHGHTPVLVAIVLNLLVIWAALQSAEWFSARIGRELLGGISKIVMVLLAAIGVMIVRTGIETYIARWTDASP